MNDNKQMDISTKGRSIRQIPISRKADAKVTATEKQTRIEPPRRTLTSNRKVSFKKIGYLSIVVIVLFGVLLSTVFSSGKLVVTPKNETVRFDSEILATQSNGAVPFETMTLEREGTKEVTATGEQNVEERSSGKIVIYNDFSSGPQTLVKETRFESNEGLIYRIKETVKVPGKSSSAPGSLEVTVYADQPGEKYNIGLSDFTLPGLKGSAQFDKVYARSKTPMAGGFVGVKRTVEESEEKAARSELQDRLKTELFKEASSSKTDGYALFNDAIFIRFEEMPTESRDNKTFIKEKAVLYGIIFDKKMLSKFVASKTIPSYSGEDVLIENMEELDFTTLNKESVRPWESGEMRFNLMGNPLVVWQFDEVKLKGELVGKLKKEARAVLTTYPSIERAEISLMPFWNRSFPNNVEKIKIIKKLDRSTE